jgi:hypothetical protein
MRFNKILHFIILILTPYPQRETVVIIPTTIIHTEEAPTNALTDQTQSTLTPTSSRIIYSERIIMALGARVIIIQSQGVNCGQMEN